MMVNKMWLKEDFNNWQTNKKAVDFLYGFFIIKNSKETPKSLASVEESLYPPLFFTNIQIVFEINIICYELFLDIELFIYKQIRKCT